MRVLVIGLDCAAPRLVFDRWRHELPSLARLMASGAHGTLRSSHPPITVPAWSVMLSGKDAGELGFYGFRNRRDHSYEGYRIADSSAVRAERIWDLLSREGKEVVLLGVPQTYPPSAVRGCLVAGFLTPSTRSEYTHPAELKEEIERVVPEYVVDVEGFRTDDKAALLERIHDKTRKHFQLARHLIVSRPWDFFMLVEMGVDRIHHGFWGFMDPAHRRYRAGNAFEDAIRDYYRRLDSEIGELISLVPDDVAILVVSDHGARSMEGGICINEWLIREGYLALEAMPRRPTSPRDLKVDWSRTRVWGEGGYYGRLFINVKGREPRGTVAGRDYEALRDELVRKLEALGDPAGRSIGTRVLKPEAIYREVNGVAPDLMAYFGDLAWRSVGSVGHGRVHTFENDTGSDEANHDWNGIFILNGTGCERAGIEPGRREGLTILDVFPLLRSLTAEPAASVAP